jgi:hypothetical protein
MNRLELRLFLWSRANRVTRQVYEKIAQNVAQRIWSKLVPMYSILRGNVAQKCDDPLL